MTNADTDDVELSVPLRPEFGSMLRTVVSSIGADLGLDLDQIDDLRLAVSEIFSVLLERPDATQENVGERDQGAVDGRCRARFSVGTDAITILLGRDTAGDLPPLDDLAETILSTVVDEHRMSEDGVVLVKRVVAPASTS